MQSKLGFQCEGAWVSPMGETPVASLYVCWPSTSCFSSPPPQAMVSNPHSLGLQAVIYEDGYTYDGNTRHRLVSCAPHPHPCPRPRSAGCRAQPSLSGHLRVLLDLTFLPPFLSCTWKLRPQVLENPERTWPWPSPQAGSCHPDKWGHYSVTGDKHRGHGRGPKMALGKWGWLGKPRHQDGGELGRPGGAWPNRSLGDP